MDRIELISFVEILGKEVSQRVEIFIPFKTATLDIKYALYYDTLYNAVRYRFGNGSHEVQHVTGDFNEYFLDIVIDDLLTAVVE